MSSRPGWMGLRATWSSGRCPAHGRGLKQDDLSSPFQPQPWYDSMIL